MKRRNFLNMPPDLFSALGAVAARSGQIEHILAVTISRTEDVRLAAAYQRVDDLRKSDQIRKETRKSFRKWALEKFGADEGGERSQEFDQLVGTWSDLSKARNDFLHGFWSIDKDSQELSCHRKGQRIVRQDGSLCAIDDVQKLAGRLRDIAVRLNEATSLHQKSPFPSVEATAASTDVDHVITYLHKHVE